MNSHIYYNDIIGRIRITAEDHAVTAIEFMNGREEVTCTGEGDGESQALLDKAYRQIDEYLRGQREEFTFPIRIAGTEFQQEVWSTLLTIPYGETRTYGEVAEMIGNPNACRAVGMANNRNRLPIVIPCHRVIGKDGRLIGYNGGIEIKKKLLEIERRGLTS
ncbi:MAG: methylated-DNA--[Mogibacterium sp.]|nr:methylated-DNA--[protein]-cysteine S-methyltransferase [Mogibacterium sp.]